MYVKKTDSYNVELYTGDRPGRNWVHIYFPGTDVSAAYKNIEQAYKDGVINEEDRKDARSKLNEIACDMHTLKRWQTYNRHISANYWVSFTFI